MEIKNIDKVIVRARQELEENGVSLTFVTLQEAVLQSKNPQYMYKFVKYVEGANVERFGAAIRRTKDAKYIEKFEEFVKANDEENDL
ncbi:MAG: hypothetical protein IJY90_03565 [Clostridia bacterium]|nr:hypothetical protein [Clostridia bacterium]